MHDEQPMPDDALAAEIRASLSRAASAVPSGAPPWPEIRRRAEHRRRVRAATATAVVILSLGAAAGLAAALDGGPDRRGIVVDGGDDRSLRPATTTGPDVTTTTHPTAPTSASTTPGTAPGPGPDPTIAPGGPAPNGGGAPAVCNDCPWMQPSLVSGTLTIEPGANGQPTRVTLTLGNLAGQTLQVPIFTERALGVVFEAAGGDAEFLVFDGPRVLGPEMPQTWTDGRGVDLAPGTYRARAAVLHTAGAWGRDIVDYDPLPNVPAVDVIVGTGADPAPATTVATTTTGPVIAPSTSSAPPAP